MTHDTTGVGRRFYVTTAIDYPNAVPHIGHALEKVAADVVARYHRLRGDDTYFSMGVDENSQHVLRAALAHEIDPRIWIDEIDTAFRLAWSKLDIAPDYWIRTTEERHIRASQEMFRRAQAKGDIYLSTYAGWYCPNDNTFYTEDELVNGHCPDHPSVIPEWVEEENYFFALTKYQQQLLAHIEAHPDFIVPASRKAEVIGLLRQGLRDFSISRIAKTGKEAWGIPVPGDSRHVLYVWFDALTNYLTTVGFPDDMALFAHYWPADTHVIGKDITRFHCLYWPAMLLSADLPLPKQIAVHGFITLEGKRISKTAGNVIDPVALVEEIGADAVRYYLTRNLFFSSDSDFSRASLVQHYNGELANELGNLLNRVVSMTKRYRDGRIPQETVSGPLENELQQLAAETFQRAEQELESWEIGNAVGSIWQLVRRANQYIEQNEPWKLARQHDQQERLDTVLYSSAEVLRLLTVLLAPFMPSSCNRIRQQLGLADICGAAWKDEGTWGGEQVTHVVPGPVVFPRIEQISV